MTNTLIIATNNVHKVEEIQAILTGYQCLTLKEAGLQLDVEEDQDSFSGNALKKARALAAKTNLPVLSDDSGLCVEALQDAPGIYSARYAGEKATDQDNYQLLLTKLQKEENRNARFVCCLAFIRNGLEYVFEGNLHGTIALQPSGNQGFGYDPVFIPRQYTETLATLGSEIKNKISHRKQALQQLFAFLQAD